MADRQEPHDITHVPSFAVVHTRWGAVVYELFDVQRRDGWVHGTFAMHHSSELAVNPDGSNPVRSGMSIAWPTDAVHAIVDAVERRDALTLANHICKCLCIETGKSVPVPATERGGLPE